MITEETKCKILNVFGYKPEDLNCANAYTAFHEIFDQDHSSDPISVIETFIHNCSEERFHELKQLVTYELSQNS